MYLLLDRVDHVIELLFLGHALRFQLLADLSHEFNESCLGIGVSRRTGGLDQHAVLCWCQSDVVTRLDAKHLPQPWR
jgi:hypothetical protein